MNRLTRSKIEEIRDTCEAGFAADDDDVISLCSMALEAVDGGWRDVKDEKPPLDVEVIIAFTNSTDPEGAVRRSSTASWSNDFKKEPHWVDPADSGQSFRHLIITHWRPLPTPPASSLEDGKPMPR